MAEEKDSKDKESKDQESKDQESKGQKSKDQKSEDQESAKEEEQGEDSQEEQQDGESQEKETKPDNRPPSIIYGPAAPRPLTMTFGELLDYHAEIRPDKPAIISHVQGYTISWSQLRNRSLQLARAMAQDGVGKGDFVALSMGSRVEYFETFYACAYLGAACITMNYAYAQDEFVALLKIIGPKMLIAPAGFQFYDYSTLFPLLDKEVPSLSKFAICEDIDGKYTFSGSEPKYVAYEKYIGQFRASASALPKVKLSCHDMVNVEFTSGSTGLPKNVALSHYNIMNTGRFIWNQVRMTDDDVICTPVPLFHSFGICVALSSAAVAGAALVFPSELFNAKAALECVEKYKCSAIFGVPTMFVNYMAHDSFENTDRSSIKWGVIAGAAMPPELLKRITNRFPLPRLYTCWGMTELSSFVTMMHETDPFDKRVHTAGRLFPGYVAKIVDPVSARVVPWGEKGEIVVSGFGQMSEYLFNPKKTAEALRQHEEDLEEGGVGGLGDGTKLRTWMHTEDEGYLDPEGYFVISGRIKDLVIRGGENISPMEIEQRLVEHEAIAQVSIIGVPDERLGEELLAFLELQEGAQKPSDDDLKAFVRQKLARFKTPKYFKWIGSDEKGIPEDWPKTDTGKISKPDLRKASEDFDLE